MLGDSKRAMKPYRSRTFSVLVRTFEVSLKCRRSSEYRQGRTASLSSTATVHFSPNRSSSARVASVGEGVRSTTSILGGASFGRNWVLVGYRLRHTWAALIILSGVAPER